jgi:FkbM family methyltransferase
MTTAGTGVSSNAARNAEWSVGGRRVRQDYGGDGAAAVERRETRRELELHAARCEMTRRVVGELKAEMGLANALDAGCGTGSGTQALQKCGLYVRGFDASMANVVEARERYPRIPFGHAGLDDAEIGRLGKFDLVLCLGALHRSENPMLAIRNLRALSGKGLLLESMCLPDEQAGMMLCTETWRMKEGTESGAAELGESDMVLYPGESCLIKMLYRAGFAAVYRVAGPPEHDDFRETPEHARRRMVLFAAAEAETVEARSLERVAEPHDHRDPWARENRTEVEAVSNALPRRIQRFLRKPARTQYISLAQHSRNVFPEMPIPLRLAFGAWWLAGRGALDHELIYNGFEATETGFVERYLQPGMTVLDIGAHHGLYTLLASKRVGPSGRVIAFEPSPRERRRLRQHVRINGCANVSVEGVALGDHAGEADLFLVEGLQDWCNSLRRPEVEERTCVVRVEVRPLDEVLRELGVSRVDFIKLDVEGAELSFLRGAAKLLAGGSRPVILAEVQDLRTRPWGYPAREIIKYLVAANYRWFAIGEDGRLLPMSTDLPGYDANLVALPIERFEEYRAMFSSER